MMMMMMMSVVVIMVVIFYRNGYSSQVTFRDLCSNCQNHQKKWTFGQYDHMLRIFWYLWWPLEQTEEITLNITLKWKDCSTNVNVRAMKIWVEKLGNTLFGVNSRIRTRDGICCQGILLPRFTRRFLDKNNEIISTTASFFFPYRPVWWTVCAWNLPAVQ